MAPELIAALGLAGTAGLSIVSATLAVKLAAARREVNFLLKRCAELDDKCAEQLEENTALAQSNEILGHALSAAEVAIREQGREAGEHRAKAPKRGANGKFIAKVPGRANGMGTAGAPEQR